MGLEHTAHYLKTKGRGEDTELVHVSKKELKGLQELAMAHGGSLTINPHTGLPEAGFLDSILPMVIGAGLTVASGGALTPLMAAGITGLGYGLVEKDLGKGLMAGLGAYGGAGLGAGLSAAGANVAADAATQTAAQTAGDVAGQEAVKQAATQGVTNQAALDAMKQQAIEEAGNTTARTAATGPSFSNVGRGLEALGNAPGRAAVMSGMSSAAPYSGLATTASLAASQPQGALAPIAPQAPVNPANLAVLSKDFKGSFPTPPSPAYKAQYQNYQQNPYNPYDTAHAASGGTMDSTQHFSSGDKVKSTKASFDYLSDLYKQKDEYLPKMDTDINVDPDLDTKYEDALNAAIIQQNKLLPRAGLTGVMDKTPAAFKLGQVNLAPSQYLTKSAASGGIMMAMGGQAGQMYPMSQQEHTNFMDPTQLPSNAMAVRDFEPATNPMTGAMTTPMASGGMTSPYNLGSYSDGGRLLKGPGDGMSDNIPATIGRKQPARLADGEFVVPADVVSHLGNGSTDAGAKKLYGMMDKIRQARTGKKKQAPSVKTDKYLPA
jgi:hypothetical protein